MGATWKRSKDVAWEQLGNEALVISPQSGARWTLNAMAAAVWSLCDGSRDSGEIARMLANGAQTESAGGSARRAINSTIERFCEALATAGLLRAVPQCASPLPVPAETARFTGSWDAPPGFRSLGLSAGPRRRPSPRGNSGPG